jgi:hypothetical protein
MTSTPTMRQRMRCNTCHGRRCLSTRRRRCQRRSSCHQSCWWRMTSSWPSRTPSLSSCPNGRVSDCICTPRPTTMRWCHRLSAPPAGWGTRCGSHHLRILQHNQAGATGRRSTRLGLRVTVTPGSRSGNTSSEGADGPPLVPLDPLPVIDLTKDKDDE